MGGNHRLGAELMSREIPYETVVWLVRDKGVHYSQFAVEWWELEMQLVRLENSHSREGGGH